LKIVSINFSNGFKNIGSKEIVLKSPRVFGKETLDNGITYAFLKLSGKVSSCIY